MNEPISRRPGVVASRRCFGSELRSSFVLFLVFFSGRWGGGGGFNFLVLEMTSWKTYSSFLSALMKPRDLRFVSKSNSFLFFFNRFTETICDCDPRFCQRKRTARFRRKQNKNETFHSIFLEKRNRKTIKEMIKH